MALKSSDGLLEVVVGEVLDLRIDARWMSLPSCGERDRAHVLDDLAAPVLDHGAAAGMAEQLALEREFDALQPLVVDAEADEVRAVISPVG